MNPLEHIMGTEEAAAQWVLSQQYIKNLCREGRVKAVQIGKTWVLDKDQSNPAQPEHPRNWRGKR